MTSALCLVHQRFSTNTFPSWKLAHPYRYICHNGEINTLRGNVNWMYARQSVLASPLFGEDMKKLLPIITPGGSDSAMLDNAVELLTLAGRSLPHVMSMLIPEAWDHDATMPEDVKAFYEYHASLMEPWDGPAAVAFTDGRVIGAKLDRNGLRPGRYLVTTDGLVVHGVGSRRAADQAGRRAHEGPAGAGPHVAGGYRAEAADLRRRSEKAAGGAAAVRAVGEGKPDHARSSAEPDARAAHGSRNDPDAAARLRLHGRRPEDDSAARRASKGEEPVGSMGIDTPLACLSDKPQLLFNYFKQTFAQVTNPAIDPIREDLVMSLNSYIGSEGNILDETPKNCHTLKLRHPIISNWRLEKLRRVKLGRFPGHHAFRRCSAWMAASRNSRKRSRRCAGARRWRSSPATRC